MGLCCSSDLVAAIPVRPPAVDHENTEPVDFEDTLVFLVRGMALHNEWYRSFYCLARVQSSCSEVQRLNNG